jgi:hypothetical protein
MTGEPTDTTDAKIETQNITDALSTLSKGQWNDLEYPIVTYVGIGTFGLLNKENKGVEEDIKFWKEAFDPNHFIYPDTQHQFDSEREVLLVLHSFKVNGLDSSFKAITTSPKDLVKSPVIYLNYNYHGKPCEARSQGAYPSIDFWKFYDNLPKSEQGSYRIPDTGSRRKFVEENFLKLKEHKFNH